MSFISWLKLRKMWREEKELTLIQTVEKSKLRERLDIGEKVLVLAERLKMKDTPKFLYKCTK